MQNPDTESATARDTLSGLMGRIDLSSRSAAFRLHGLKDADQLEAFMLAVLQVTAHAHSYRDQDKLIRDTVAGLGEDIVFHAKGCGVAVVRTPDTCEIWHGLDNQFCVRQLATEMVSLLEELSDPAGMIFAGIAAGYALCPRKTERISFSEQRLH